MTTTPKILLKKSSVAGRVPGTSDLDYGELAINFEDGKIYYKDASNNIKAFIDSARVEVIANAVEVIAQSQLDSSEVTGLVDSAYVQVRVPESYLEGIIDSSYVQARIDKSFIDTLGINADTLDGYQAQFFIDKIDSNTAGMLDSAEAIALIDSSYIQSRQIQYNTSNFTDSAYVTTQINALIDGAPGTLNTLNEIAAALNDDDSAYDTLIGLIAAKSDFDSASAISLVDSSYVQARQITYDFLDSAEAIDLIDSAYIRLRQQYDYFYITGSTKPTKLTDFENDARYITDESFDDFESREFLGNQGGLTDKVYTFIVPAGVTSISAVAIAGGGGGGEAASGSDGVGGGGGLAYDTSLAVTPGESLTITVGHSGNGGQAPSDPPNSNGTGDAAVNTTIKRSSTVLLQANGGTAGSGASNGAGGSGGTTLSSGDGGGNGGVRGAGQYTGNGSSSGAASLLGTSALAGTKVYGEGGAGTLPGKKGAVRIIWGAGRSYPDTKIVQTFNNVYVDSAHVQLHAVGLSYNRLTNLPSIPVTGTDFADSAYIHSVLPKTGVDFADSSWIIANFLDSALTTQLIDSAYIGNVIQSHKFDVVNSGSGHYAFTGYGFASSANNPDLYLVRGETYEFVVNASGHPFYIKTVSGTGTGNQYSTGVSNNGQQTGTVTFTVPMDAPNKLFYNCSSHSSMNGTIYIHNNSAYLDSSEVDAIITALGGVGLDSALALNVIDSAYISGIVDSAYISGLGFGTGSGSLDSALTGQLIDSAYIQLRQSSTGSGGLDSALTTQLIDSAYVQLRQSAGGGGGSAITIQDEGSSLSTAATTINFVGSGVTASGTGATKTITISGGGGGGGGLSGTPSYFHYTADSGQITFSGADNDSDTLAYTADAIAVYLNGILLVDSVDYTATNGTSIILTDSSSSGDILSVQKFTAGTDSAAIIQLIDSAYISTKVDFTRGEFTTNRTDFTADSGQTIFSATSIDTANLDVYLNGILQIPVDDYTTSKSAVTFNAGVDSGYSVTVVERRGRLATTRGLVENKFQFTTASPTTTITGTDDTGKTLDYAIGLADVYLNGILLRDSNDYATNNGTSVTLVSATDSGDLVTIINRKGIVTTSTIGNFEFTADSGQTIFSGNDISGKTLGYSPDAIQVYLNGIALKNNDYIAANGTSITLSSGADSGDDILVSAFSNPGHNMEMYKFVADSAQTIFQGNDASGASLAYQPGNIQVFLNGLLLNDSDDYVATGGIGVRLLSAASLNDELKVTTFTTNSNYVPTNPWYNATANPTLATSGDKIFVDTSGGAKTVTLPSTALLGNEIRIIDVTGNAGTNNITVGRNGHKIQGAASDLIININRTALGLVYYNAAQGWLLIEN